VELRARARRERRRSGLERERSDVLEQIDSGGEIAAEPARNGQTAALEQRADRLVRRLGCDTGGPAGRILGRLDASPAVAVAV
jgi:hypothetical protein